VKNKMLEPIRAAGLEVRSFDATALPTVGRLLTLAHHGEAPECHPFKKAAPTPP
jgi:hypothetical protein